MLRGVGARVLHGGVQVHRVKQQCVGGGVVPYGHGKRNHKAVLAMRFKLHLHHVDR